MPHRHSVLMGLLPPTLRTALGALRRNVMRSALTTLGIIIGVGAVIAMVEIGQGSKSAIQQTIASMGANSLLVNSGAASSGGVSFGSGSVLTLTPQDSAEIARQCPAVEAVAPIVRARAGHLRQQQLGADEHLRHHAGVFGCSRLGKHGRRDDVHRPRRACRAPRLRHRRNDCARAVPRTFAGREGHSCSKRIAARRRRAEPQGGEHLRHGSGRYCHRALDHH